MAKEKRTVSYHNELRIEEYLVETEPYYLPQGDEIELFEAAYAERIPLILKGPTGCGKTRFVEYMAYRLSQPSSNGGKPGRRTQSRRRSWPTRWASSGRTRRSTPSLAAASEPGMT